MTSCKSEIFAIQSFDHDFTAFPFIHAVNLFRQSKQEGKGQESIQSSTTPDPGYKLKKKL